MTWHVPGPGVEAYLDGRLTAVQEASVDTHIQSCSTCQALVAHAVADGGGTELDRIWADVVDEVDRPPLGLIERLAHALGVPEHLVRLLASAPGLRWPWLAVVVISSVSACGLALAGRDPELSRLPFLVLAPLLPLAGVAISYGPASDAAHELASTSPFGSGRLTLVRAVAAVAVTIPVAGAIGVFVPDIGWHAAAWLAPSLALSSATLAASRRVSLRAAAVSLGGGWLAFVLVTSGWRPGVRWSALAHPDLAFAAWLQPVYLALTAACALVIASSLRRDAPLAEQLVKGTVR